MPGALTSPDEDSSSIRPHSSPRSSRSNSRQSSFSFGISSEVSQPHTDSSEEQSPTRGRTLVRKPAHRTTNRRATTIHQERPRTIDWNSIFTQERLTSRDLTAEPQGIFDSILEPLPPGVERFRSSLSEELYRSATWGSSIDLSRFGDHRDTFALLGLRHLQSRRVSLPAIFFERLLLYIDFATYLAIRLSCRCWSEAVTRICPIVSPPVCQLPTEILERIYVYLDPVDFNAVRHTCRAWMIASLDGTLLRLMLGRGGWQGAANADAALQGDLDQQSVAKNSDEEWVLSKRLATECSLRPDWTGNGLPENNSQDDQGHLTSLRIASTTDFSELSNGYGRAGEAQHGSAFHFTVSACNRFVLVTESCVIYIYSIQDSARTVHRSGGHLSPLTAVICPHRVLAVSMDTTAQRFAVAALLEGRIGVVCDLSNSTTGSLRLSNPRALPTAIRESRGPHQSPRPSSEHAMTDVTSPHEYAVFQMANARATAWAIADATLPEIHGACATRQSWTSDDPLLTPLTASQSSHDKVIPMGATGHMPVSNGARSIYHKLCSAEDPPRSVAICPQRRCVAFGCAAGIELHWIDALTGQELNRWFPLTAPSDFLYFLPPRPGVDSAKKLRLISSAGHPKLKEALHGRFFPQGINDRTRHEGMTWDETLPGGELGDSPWRGIGWCNHVRAVPVSDGWNILFTDPEDGYLCLGRDAPLLARATKLMRRFIFDGPRDDDGKAIVPNVYTSGAELKWGVRVVVGYGEALWLFVVPPDAYFMDKGCGNVDTPELNMVDGVEPTSIQGVEIGRVPALSDVAVDASGGDLTIWAFAADGMAYVWQTGSRATGEERRTVLRDGTVCSQRDGEGDTFMHDLSDKAVHFDGNASIPLLPQFSYKQDRIIDIDGDVAMRDIDDDEGYSSEFDAAGGAFAIHAPPLWGRWSEEDADWVPDYLGHRGGAIEDEGVGIDVLEMSRMEVEVWCG